MLPDRTFSLDINTGQPRVVSLRLLADSFRNSLPPSDGMGLDFDTGHNHPMIWAKSPVPELSREMRRCRCWFR